MRPPEVSTPKPRCEVCGEVRQSHRSPHWTMRMAGDSFPRCTQAFRDRLEQSRHRLVEEIPKTHTVKKPEKIEDGFALRLWRSVDDVANSCNLRRRSSVENYFFVVHFLIVSHSFSKN